jgi:hypothetical protein
MRLISISPLHTFSLLFIGSLPWLMVKKLLMELSAAFLFERDFAHNAYISKFSSSAM